MEATKAVPSRRRGRSLSAFTVAALLASVIGTPSPAGASPTPHTSPEAAAALSARLADRSAGSYLDAGGRTVVTVTDAAAATAVRRAGFTARFVPRGAVELGRVVAELDRSARTPGTAWWIDPASGQVVLAVDGTVTGERRARITSVVAGLGDAVRVQADPGVLSPRISGGQLIHSAAGRCTLGFNVRSGGTYYLLTAGHCVNASPTWYTDPGRTTHIGPRVASSFPGNDYGLVRYDNASVSHPSSVHLPADDTGIDGSKIPPRFWPIIVSGGISGVHHGTVTALNLTVNYANGSVSGLIRTDTCSEPGDSGSPLFSGSTAHGLLSGGTGNCATGGVSYFQPTDEPIAAYGLSFF